MYPVPTKEMFAYAVRTSLGDDVYNEPSTIALEEHIAKVTGKEAALFVSSGTMGNQLAIRSHLQQPPNSIVCDVRGHINKLRCCSFHSLWLTCIGTRLAVRRSTQVLYKLI